MKFLNRFVCVKLTFHLVILLPPCVRIFRLPLPGLNPVFPHGEGSVDAVQLVVEAARVAHGLAVVVSPPQGGRGRAAVGAAQADAPGGGLEHGALEKNETFN